MQQKNRKILKTLIRSFKLPKAEPYKIKMVEPIQQISRIEREAALIRSGFNPFALKSSEVYIDLLTDSGTGSMSDQQWGGIMTGDESYAGSRSFYRFESVVQNITGYKYVIPVHQGRGAEQVLFPNIIKNKGDLVLSNMHFDTTKAHVEIAGGRAINLIHETAFQTEIYAPFKGDFNIPLLKKHLENHENHHISMIIITATNNSVGGQPISLANMREVSALAREKNIPVIIDSARYAENAYFIQQREKGYSKKTMREIAKEMFDLADGMVMSAKKCGLVNMGGFIAIKNDQKLFDAARTTGVAMEGFPTYGGLSGRDMEALAIGLDEALEDRFMKNRVEQVAYLGDLLRKAGVPIQYPTGGHAVFVDCKKVCSHIPFYQFPAQALCNQLYLESGVRSVEIGSFLLGRNPDTGENLKSPLELMRLTIPKRVYTNRHMDVVAAGVIEACKNADKLKGFEFEFEPKVLRHFMARLRPIE